MPLQATSGAASYDAFGGGVPVVPNYIENVFSTWLYTGTSATQTITNGIDLSGKGGMTWFKTRSTISSVLVFDTLRGYTNTNAPYLATNVTNAEEAGSNIVNATSTGFDITVAGGASINLNGTTYASWTFRKQPKFFDVVTWSGNGTDRTLTSALGSQPGCIIVKRTNSTSDWWVYHRGVDATVPQNFGLYLNTTAARYSGAEVEPSGSTGSFFVRSGTTNVSGGTYVAYLFAHDAGGFGLTGTDNVISCGSFTTDGSGNATVSLGYEPQWLLIKSVTFGGWWLTDTMRGMSVASGDNVKALFANTSGAESNANEARPNATGFTVGPSGNLSSSDTFIYIAIRRGPMKVPTSGTSVFLPSTAGATTPFNVGFPPDLALWSVRDSTGNKEASTRLQGGSELFTNTTGAESSGYDIGWASKTNFWYQNVTGGSMINWMFRRAPSFFDVVCYTGTGTAGQTYTHNLGVVPELMIVKGRSIAEEWNVYFGNNTNYLKLNRNDVPQTATTRWNDTSPTSSVFSVGTSNWVNASGSTYVAYLFASLAGVSKVFSYTGNGSSQTINCGFTGGSRFVLIKRTDAIGNWYVWDSARGIVAGNDPHLSLNSTAAEVTTDDTIDTDSTGFVVNQVSATNVNVSSATYIGLAIA